MGRKSKEVAQPAPSYDPYFRSGAENDGAIIGKGAACVGRPEMKAPSFSQREVKVAKADSK